MDEADQILVISLRQVLDEKHLENVSSAADITANLLIRACVRCLAAITPDAPKLPEALPPDMSGRFRVGTDVAARLQGLGLRGNIGFHQLLYPNEADVRTILMFLLDRLPKASADEPSGASTADQASAAVRSAMAAWHASEKAGPSPRARPAGAGAPFWTLKLRVPGAKSGDAAHQPGWFTSQARPAARGCPSVLE